MEKRIEILSSFYGQFDEDARLSSSRQTQLEFLTTMHYIRRHAPAGGKLLEIGAGTGRYSAALAKEGYDMTALELVEHNLRILKSKGANVRAYQGDALDLSRFPDGSFDMTLSLGPMYHLYDPDQVRTAIREAIRVTKPGGVLLFAFLSIHAIMANNYLRGNTAFGIRENFDEHYRVLHFPEQLFTGYEVSQFEALFRGFPVTHLTTAAADGILELASGRGDFAMSDEDFRLWTRYHLATCEKRENLGHSSHLLYLCQKA